MRRLFLLVAAVVLVDTMFFAAVAPLLPQYADEFGLSKTGAGILSAAYPAGTFVGAVPPGWLAARGGVKRTLLGGFSMLGFSSLVFAFASHIVLLDAARFVQGFGGACMWAAGMAWLVSASPPERRGELIGSGPAGAIGRGPLGPGFGGGRAARNRRPGRLLGAGDGDALGRGGGGRARPGPGVRPLEPGLGGGSPRGRRRRRGARRGDGGRDPLRAPRSAMCGDARGRHEVGSAARGDDGLSVRR